jgi:hypothetical protein
MTGKKVSKRLPDKQSQGNIFILGLCCLSGQSPLNLTPSTHIGSTRCKKRVLLFSPETKKPPNAYDREGGLRAIVRQMHTRWHPIHTVTIGGQQSSY